MKLEIRKTSSSHESVALVAGWQRCPVPRTKFVRLDALSVTSGVGLENGQRRQDSILCPTHYLIIFIHITVKKVGE